MDWLAVDFAQILFVLLLVSGAIWLIDSRWLKPRRRPDEKEPWWVEFGSGFFPVILIVFVFRSFIFEPFKIPSGSMMPTLLTGDFILVNKYTYGIRLPIINKKVVDINQPQRGDVMVFRYPVNPAVNYIKRVVGVPGDKVAYQNKRLTINGEPVEVEKMADYLQRVPDERGEPKYVFVGQFVEKLGEAEHRFLNDDDVPAFINDVLPYPYRENCLYNNAGVICTVPPGHYFMMGDNRDNSRDSRFWGFVPEENIVGKAFFIWLHADSLIPPYGIDFGRVGSFK